MATQHRLIPDGERHEPKGISTATNGQVYVANGSESGTWKDRYGFDTVVMTDVSEAGFVLVPVVSNATVVSIRLMLANAITVADSTITVTRGGDDASLGTVTIPFTGSAEGTYVDFIPAGNSIISASSNRYLKIASDGGSTTAARLFITVKYRITE